MEYARENYKTGELICEECADASYSDPMVTSTTYRYGEKTRTHYNDTLDCFIDAEYGEEHEEAPQGCPIDEVSRVNTDGWRWYQKVDVRPAWKILESGWATGRWSDVSWKHAFNDFCDELENGNIYTNFPVVIIACPTSNLFSTSISVVVMKKDEDAFWEVVADHCGLNKESLKLSLT